MVLSTEDLEGEIEASGGSGLSDKQKLPSQRLLLLRQIDSSYALWWECVVASNRRVDFDFLLHVDRG